VGLVGGGDRGRLAGHVEWQGQQIVVRAQRIEHVPGTARGGDDGVAAGRRGLGDEHAETARRAGDQPDFIGVRSDAGSGAES
jgi:hypothetical protein